MHCIADTEIRKKKRKKDEPQLIRGISESNEGTNIFWIPTITLPSHCHLRILLYSYVILQYLQFGYETLI